MFKALGNLNVLEILRVGLAGLCFLLSLLAFRLIQREQDRASSPRRGILRAIYIFMGTNLMAAVLVGAAAYLGPRQQGGTMTADLGAKTYMTDSLSYLVDLTSWTEQTHGPVRITRSDSIRKVSETHDDYVVPYYTTGDRIDAKFLSYSSHQPDFDNPTAQPGFNGKHYLYRIPVGDEPKDYTEFVSTIFTFPNGFQNPASEWWEASVAYPSKTVSVVIRFPDGKPCAKVKVYKIAGIGEKQPIRGNEPVVSNEKTIVMWVGLNIEANTRIHFDWDW
jgi:hypothetical protein